MNFEFDLNTAIIGSMSQSQAILYSKIKSYKDAPTGCRESISELAENCLCSNKTIERALKELIIGGYIIKGEFNRHTNTYSYYAR